MKRAPKDKLGRSITLFYKKLLAEIKEGFFAVFTYEGKAEFDAEYGVRSEDAFFDKSNIHQLRAFPPSLGTPESPAPNKLSISQG